MLSRRFLVIFLVPGCFSFFILLSWKTGLHTTVVSSIRKTTENFLHKGEDEKPADSSSKPPPPPPPLPKHPIYKPSPEGESIIIVDNFPLATNARSKDDLPPVPSWNRPPREHVPERTPLFIGFTRNWRLLQQAVVSYITAGWPPEDIFVVDNTGTMHSNRKALLTLQNPFYLDYKRLTTVFGVNIITTPTLLTFAQLQNFYLYEALKNEYSYFYWSHMDVVAISQEDSSDGIKSLYLRAVDTLRETLAPGFARDSSGREGRWAIRFFAYDRLALVNTAAFVEIGGWDPLISYYTTDCDMHERLEMADFKLEIASAGLVYDLGSSLDDLLLLYRRQPDNDTAHAKLDRKPSELPEDSPNSDAQHDLLRTLEEMQENKATNKDGRNVWQMRQEGGKGEPFYRDAAGFEKAIEMTIDNGRNIYAEKWGHRGCDLRGVGLRPDDAWLVEHDWDRLDEKHKSH